MKSPLILAGTCLAFTCAATVRYVDVNSSNPVSPYTNWATAATVIQDAVDVAVAGDDIVVTNGVYATGGRTIHGTMTNRVAVDKALSLRSVNGPEFTVIQGYQLPGTTNGDGAVRCVYLTNGASLSGFTLTNGATRGPLTGGDPQESGGGVWCESANAFITNCVLTGNAARRVGGGALYGTLNNCLLIGNSAQAGGGAWESTMNNCTLTGNRANGDGGGAGGYPPHHRQYPLVLNYCVLSNNSAWYGGGASWGRLDHCLVISNYAGSYAGGVYGYRLSSCVVVGNTAVNYAGGVDGGYSLTNCIVYYNTASNSPNHASTLMNSSCTTPHPAFGVGNILGEPLFVDQAAGDFRLQPNSPCINAGNSITVSSATDLDGNPRIVGGTVDIGAYEFQSPQSTISYAWLQQFGLPTNGSADYSDSDLDGHNAWQEWRANTDPTDALSALRMLSPTSNDSGVTVRWESVDSRSYWLERAGNLAAYPAFSIIATNLPGQIGSTTFTDTNAISGGPYFYRVGIQP